jgi:hypothetical protein
MGRTKFVKMRMKHLNTLLICGLISAFCGLLSSQEPRWREDRVNVWYRQQPWLVGANIVPADAINELEMWPPDTFNPAEIASRVWLGGRSGHDYDARVSAQLALGAGRARLSASHRSVSYH